MRAALLARRAALPAGARRSGSAAIARLVIASEAWRAAGSVAAFVGVRDEPDTAELLGLALAQGRVLWLPRVVDRERIEFAHIDDPGQLVDAGFGLREPDPSRPGRALAATGVELVLVPGLAFGRDGSRLGSGRGYYDRALAELGAGSLRVGVCFAALFDPPEGIPMEPHDVHVDAVVTESAWIDRAIR